MLEIRKKDGFTLIELLAVIVILAVIALISTPAVMNVINQSRQKAAEDSAYGVVESVKSYQAQQMLVSDDVKDTITVEWVNESQVKINSGAVVSVPFSITGVKPTGGGIGIYANGDATAKNLLINGYKCNMPRGGNMTCVNNA